MIEDRLIQAIIAVESSGNPWAIRFEKHYRWLYCPVRQEPSAFPYSLPGCSQATELNAQKTSWGLMQIMGAVAREYGFRGTFLSELCHPDLNVDYGTKYLQALHDRFFDRHGINGVIAAYNAGSVRMQNGLYENQTYVDKVLSHL